MAEALQAAVISSLLGDEDVKYTTSFYDWAVFIVHGFASVKLDEALLGQAYDRLVTFHGQPPNDDGQDNDVESDLAGVQPSGNHQTRP